MTQKLIAAVAIALLSVLAAAAPRRQGESSQPARWLVLLELGPKYDTSKSIREQVGFADHVAAVNKLATEGALLLGGPLLEGAASAKPTGAAMIIEAANETAVRKLLQGDPLVQGERLKIAAVRAFFVGAGAWIPSDKAAEKPAKPSGKVPEKSGGH